VCSLTQLNSNWGARNKQKKRLVFSREMLLLSLRAAGELLHANATLRLGTKKLKVARLGF